MAVIATGRASSGASSCPARARRMVQMLIDRNAAAGALVERSRAQGVIVAGEGDRLRLDYVSDASDIVAGDTVVTSGIDGIYPKGFVIGRVETIDRSGGAYRRIVVKPAADVSMPRRRCFGWLLLPTPAKAGVAL